MFANKILVVFLLIYAKSISAQGLIPIGARSMSMANCSVSNVDLWAHHHNPGAIASLSKIQAGVSYENRFLNREMQSQGFVVVLPLKVGVMSVGGSGFGYSQLRTYKAGIGYAMQLAEYVKLGVQLNYQTIRINPVYGNGHGLTAEVGVLTQLNEKTTIGLGVFNLGRTISSEFALDRYSTCMRLGMSYFISKEVMYNAEIEKDVEHPLRLKNAIEYKPLEHFTLRGGVATEPLELSFGFGYNIQPNFSFNAGCSFVHILGWSPHFSFQYGF